MGIVRKEPLYQQLAAVIREAIYSGEYAPGQSLPSETDLMATHQVSRPTARQAIAMLRAEGLVDVRHGKGSFVRTLTTATDATPVERTIYRNGTRYSTPLDDWTEVEPPHTYRTATDPITARLLALDEGEALFGTDRLFTHPTTGVRILHCTLIPFATADATPLADAPDTHPGKAYAILATAGHPLTWRETVRTRLPQPDERTTLALPEATPLLITYRTTLGTAHQPLILEETRTGGDRTELTYNLAAEAPARTRHAKRPERPE